MKKVRKVRKKNASKKELVEEIKHREANIEQLFEVNRRDKARIEKLEKELEMEFTDKLNAERKSKEMLRYHDSARKSVQHTSRQLYFVEQASDILKDAFSTSDKGLSDAFGRISEGLKGHINQLDQICWKWTIDSSVPEEQLVAHEGPEKQKGA